MFVEFWHDRRGSISIAAALVLPVLIGLAGLATEFGSALLTKSEMQRVADLAAYSGAIAYNATGSTSSLNEAVGRIATLNGIASAAATPTLVSSPTGDGNQAVLVTVTGTVPLGLSWVLDFTTNLVSVTAAAYAELKSGGSACVIALQGNGTGVTLGGGTILSAPGCAVASNSTVMVPNGTSMTTPAVNFNSSTALSTDTIKNIRPPAGKSSVTITRKATVDPLSNNTTVKAATAHLSSVALLASPNVTAPSAPSAPTVPSGKDLSFGWYPQQMSANGCNGTLSGNTWQFTCNGAGPFKFGNVTVPGGQTVNFVNPGTNSATYDINGTLTGGTVTFGSSTNNIYNIAGDLSTTGSTFGAGNFNIGGSITTSGNTTFGSGTFNVVQGVSTTGTTKFGAGTFNIGGSISTSGNTTFGSGTFNVVQGISATETTTFGAGTFNIGWGISTSGGSTTTFGAGTFNVGRRTTACSSGYSICNFGTSLTIAGPSTFVLAGGIYNTGGSTLTLGSSTAGNTSPATNSFNIGRDDSGNSLRQGGGAKTTFADATGAGDIFKMAGNIDIASGGGSCLVLSAATDHDINGYFSLAGGAYLGAGTYSVSKYVALGANGGGDVWCTVNGSSQNLGMSGSGVTFVIGATSTLTSRTCSGTAFCVAAGYSHVTLTAPTSGTVAGLVVVGPTTSTNSAGATLAEGSSGTSLSGVFYLPYGPVTMSGGASVGNGIGQCLELIGSKVDLNGGSAFASTCSGLGGSSGTTIVLVQ